MNNRPEDIMKESEGIGVKYLIQAVIDSDHDEVCRQLDSGVVVTAEYEEKNALCIAASRGMTDIVQLLLDRGAEVNQRDNSDKMWFTQAIHKAAAEGHLSVVKALLSHGVCVNAYDEEYRSPLHWAATKGQLSVAQYLIMQGALVNMVQADGYSALHCATCLGHVEMCEYLLKEGAEINKADMDGWTVLHAAACYSNRHLPLVDLFLLHGARVSQTTKDGETALHIAVEGGKLEIVKKMVEAGTPLELQTIHGHTALFVSICKDHLDVAFYLIDMGADMNTKNSCGLSPLNVATLRGNVPLMRLLLEAGADLSLHWKDWFKMRPIPVLPSSKNKIYQSLKDLVRVPKTLEFLCCILIRKQLHKPVSQNVASLVLPVKLKDLISLKHFFMTYVSDNEKNLVH